MPKAIIYQTIIVEGKKGWGSSQPITGNGDPTNVVTPTELGLEYQDLDNWDWYKASGLTSADRVQIMTASA